MLNSQAWDTEIPAENNDNTAIQRIKKRLDTAVWHILQATETGEFL
jgi:hypothetical protein